MGGPSSRPIPSPFSSLDSLVFFLSPLLFFFKKHLRYGRRFRVDLTRHHSLLAFALPFLCSSEHLSHFAQRRSFTPFSDTVLEVTDHFESRWTPCGAAQTSMCGF